MTKAQLESKHLAELHELAADAGIERYRMLSRAELIEKLADGGAPQGASKPQGARRGGDGGQRRQRDRSRKPREGREEREPRKPRQDPPAERPERKPEPSIAAATTPPPARPKRKRRRRWGRRRKGIRVHDLLLPASASRQALVYAESREGCTALLRQVAAELSSASNGPDPIALLVDPTPEELADWKREAPAVEIVSAGKARHADDALAQARTRANSGEEVIVLIDSLTRFAESFAGAAEARELFDAGLSATGGTLTVVAALERPA